MREILFRGKRIKDGKWVYGLPVDYCNEKYILVLTNFEEERVYEQYPHKEMLPHKVVPETVGQYTGLKDKNGKKIFEGGIVVDRWANEYTPVFQNGIYMAYNPKHLTENGPSTQFNVIWKDGCEIIGNIHEEVHP